MSVIYNVGQLKAALAGFPDNAPVITQVVAHDGKAWNLFLTVEPHGMTDFKWEVNPVILRAGHPELKTLPKVE